MITKFKAQVRSCVPCHGPTLVSTFGAFITKEEHDSLASIKERIAEVEAERAKWVRPMAEAQIAYRNDPCRTAAEIATFSNESDEALQRRYEEAANRLYQVGVRIRNEARTLILGILEKLDRCLVDVMESTERTNRKAAERFGVKYDPLQDHVLNSIAAFREVAHNRLNNDAIAIGPDQLEAFLGPLKPKKAGLFS